MTDTERISLAVSGLCEVCHALNRNLDALAQRVSALEQRQHPAQYQPPAGLLPGQTWTPGPVLPLVGFPFHTAAEPQPAPALQVTFANGAHNG